MLSIKKKWPEVRTSEIKGMMRYVYRIICPTDYGTLAKDEAELFGGAAGAGGLDSGHASPIRLLICGNNIQKESGRLLRHKKERNPFVDYLKSGDFELIVRLNPYVSPIMQKYFPSVDLNWYVELIELAFLLCGLGKRSRKGRGSVAVNSREVGTKEETLNWICCTMNKITAISSKRPKEIYRYEDEAILSTYPVNIIYIIERPVIQKIRIGMKLTPGQVDKYLWAIDKTSHDVKADEGKTGNQKSATGSAYNRFASPLIISLIKTSEGLHPLYVFVKAVNNSKEIDSDCGDRESFIQSVEIETEGRIRV